VIPTDPTEQRRLEDALGFRAHDKWAGLNQSSFDHEVVIDNRHPLNFGERGLVAPGEFWARYQQRLSDAIEQKAAYIDSCRRALAGHRKDLKRVEGEYAAAFQASREMSPSEALADPVRRRALDQAVAGWDAPLGAARATAGGTECLIRDAEDAIVEYEQRAKFASKHKPVTISDLYDIARELLPRPEPLEAA
jgi:hypothetical protein